MTIYCVEDCTKGRKDLGDMIRCCLCAQWYHLECINIDKTEATGVWPCLECRKISANLKFVTDTIVKMTATVESLTNKIDTLQKDAAKQKEELLKDNKELKDTVEHLRKDIQLKSDRGRDRDAVSRYSLVIGDGSIKDIDENKLKDTKVISKPKGELKDVQDIVSRLPDRYPGITIVAGGEDCDADPSASAQDITESYRQLIRDAKEKCESVVVSSICPRLYSTETQDKIDAVNSRLTTGNVKDPVADQLSKLVGQVDEIKTMVTQIDKRVHQLECNKQPVPKRAGKYSPKKKIPSCERCGRKGHALADCVAKIHVKGFPLKGQAPTSGGRE